MAYAAVMRDSVATATDRVSVPMVPRAPEPAAKAEDVTACFSVVAQADPGVMPRVLELFAKRNLVPTAWHSRLGGPDGNELVIDVQMRGMDQELARYVAECLRQVVRVDTVLMSQRVGATV